MQIEGFEVVGWRSLASVEEIPVRRPTILTGANDGGKTASIAALEFLLGGRPPDRETRTWAREEDHPEGGFQDDRFARVVVAGRFSLADDPHRPDIKDAVRKIKGLAKYAADDGVRFGRIESIIVDVRKNLIF